VRTLNAQLKISKQIKLNLNDISSKLTSSHLNNRHVLITGATGFVGQHLTKYLLKNKKISIRILVQSMRRVNEVFGIDKNLLDVVIADLDDPDSLNNVCRDIEAVFHIASLGTTTSKPIPNADKYNRINVHGTRQLASEALQSGVQRFVYVSSTGAMGAPSDQVITEKSACQPKSHYQISKWAAEKELLDLYHNDGLYVTIIRPCLIAGAGKRGGELLKLFKLCRKGIFPIFSGKLDVEKPITWVDDVLQAIVRASAYGRAGEVYLITSGKNYKLGEILQVAGELVNHPKPYRTIPLIPIKVLAHISTPIAKMLRFSPPISPDRLEMFIANRNIDITKAREELGYNPEQQNVFDMLARTYEYYVQTGQL
jgi:nucleoside-diphosphate-sugar epimerase